MAKAKRYTAEFKARAIKQVVEDRQNVVEVAKQLGISYKSLYLWLRDQHSHRNGGTSLDVRAIRQEMACLEIQFWSLEKELTAWLNPQPNTTPYKLDIRSEDDGPDVLSHYLTYVRDKKTQTLEPRGVLILKLPERFHRRQKKLARAK